MGRGGERWKDVVIIINKDRREMLLLFGLHLIICRRSRGNTKSKSFWALFNNNNKMIIWRKWGEARRRDNIFGTVVFLWMFCLFYNVLGIIFTIIALFCTLLLTLRQQNVPYWLRTYRTCFPHRTEQKRKIVVLL